MTSPFTLFRLLGSSGEANGKESTCQSRRRKRDESLIPGSGSSPGVRNDNLLQYSCLESSMDRITWWAIVSVPQGVRHD